MQQTEPNAPLPPSIKSIMASISSNEAKILALERRMTGVDPGRSLSSGGAAVVGTFTQLPGASSAEALGSTGAGNIAGNQRGLVPAIERTPLAARTVKSAEDTAAATSAAAAADSAKKRRRTEGTPDASKLPTTLPVATSPSGSRPPLLDIAPTGLQPTSRLTVTDSAAAAAAQYPAVRACDGDGVAAADVVPPSPENAVPPGDSALHTPTPGLAAPAPLAAVLSYIAGEASTAAAAVAVRGAVAAGVPATAEAAACGAQHAKQRHHQQQHPQQPQQPQLGATPPASSVAAVSAGGGPSAAAPAGFGGGSGGGGGSRTRARKRKQQEPKHESTAATAPRAANTTTTPGVNAGPAAAAVGAAAGVQGAAAAAAATSTPRRSRGSAAGPPQERGGGGGVPGNPQGASPRLARHLFDEAGQGPAGGGGGGGGGRSSCSAGGGGVVARVQAPAAGAVAAAAPPPSAQKRSILSYYPPVLGGGGNASGVNGGGGGNGLVGAGQALPPPLVLDQNSRDSLPQSLHQHLRQIHHHHHQQQRRDAAPGVGGVAVERSNGEDGGGGDATALPLQLQQCQQQVTALQAQVMQVQSAMAAQQAAAGTEIERLRRELEARCLEATALQEKARSQEAALQKALSAEAAARAGLESLQAASAAEAARWSAEAAEAARVASEREGHYRGELARLVQSSARLERDLARSQLSANAARLGSLTLLRTGPMQMAEVWEDGTAFQQLAARRAAVTAAREEVVAAQKLLRKRLAPPPAGVRAGAASASSSPFPSSMSSSLTSPLGGEESTLGAVQDAPYMSGLEFVAADEVYKTRLAVLKREEESLRDEEERLTREKFKQIRAVKLAREEDASRFGRWPVLSDRPGPEGRPRYVLMNLLGKGGFSEVFKAYDLVEARPVCVKIHALTPGWPSAKKENYVRHAIREYDIHRSLRHPAVVALLDVLEIDLDTFATVLELCEGGDLDTLLREHRTLPEKEARCLMAQIFSGLRYLVSRRVIHYDLKPANILFDSLGQAKITDFGLSKQVTEGQTLAGIELTSQGAGTYWYLPPEAFETGGSAPPRISNKLDVWSAGVIFYSMLYGKKPYGEAMSQEQMLRERVMAVPREVEFPSRPAVSPEAKDFIRRCLAWQQDKRPDVQAAATDPYLTGGTAATAGATAGMGASSGGPVSAFAGAVGGGAGGGALGMGLAAAVVSGSRR